MTISTNVNAELINEVENAKAVNVRFTTDMAKGWIQHFGGTINKLADYLQFEFWDGSILSLVEQDDSVVFVDETAIFAAIEEESHA